MAFLTTSLRAEIFKVSLATNRSSEKPSQSQLRIKNQGGISNRHADQRALLFNFREESNHEILPFWHLSPLNDTENILRGLWDRIYSIFLQIYALFQTILSLFGITRCGTYEPAIYKAKALCTIIKLATLCNKSSSYLQSDMNTTWKENSCANLRYCSVYWNNVFWY